MKIANKWEVDEKDVYTIVTTAGEYVGRLEFTESNIVRVKNPMLLMTDPESGTQQFIPTISMTGTHEPEYVDFNAAAVIAITETTDGYAKEYVRATSRLILPNA